MINKRIFGADIPILVKKKLEARQKVAEGNKAPGDSIQSEYQDERRHAYTYDELITSDFNMEADLSSRTPFIRMWTGVSLVRALNIETDELSAVEYKKLTQEEKQGYKVLSTKVYALGTNNLSTVDSINQSNQSMNKKEQISYAAFPDEHGVDKDHNKFMKPQAGITGLSSETGGTLGSIKTTEVKFKVMNFADYDQIYNKYFLRPGAQLFVDFGWNSLRTNLYNPQTFLDNSDGIGIETKLYGQKKVDKKAKKDGFVTENGGDVETLVGIVTGYDSKINEDGSVDCSVEITSKNSALNYSPKTPTENVEQTTKKFEFEIDSLVKYEAVYKLSDKDNRNYMNAAQKKANSSTSTTDKVEFEAWIEQLAFTAFGSSHFTPSSLAMQSGIFLVGDDASSSDQFMSWGLLEDRIFNKYFGHGDDVESINSEDKEKLEVSLDSSKSFTTYQYGFIEKQFDIDTAPNFIVPKYWDKTWQSTLENEGGKSGKTLKERREDFVSNGTSSSPNAFDKTINDFKKLWLDHVKNIKFDKDETKYFQETTPISTSDKALYRVPLREIFVNVNIVKRAFTNDDNTTFKSVITEILDKINGDAYGIWNWIMAGVGDDNRLSIIDTNQMGIAESKKVDKFDKMFVFKVMGKESMVKSYDVSFEMPAGEIGSMYAIQAMSGTSKKMAPISTMIEEQAALQNLLTKVGEGDASNVKFRYLPDLAPYNAEQQDKDKDENAKLGYMYNDSSDIIANSKPANEAYGFIFDGKEVFDTYFSDKESIDENTKTLMNEKIKEINIQEQLDAGFKVVTNKKDKWSYLITKKYKDTGFPKPMPLPMKLTLSIYGIASLKPGDIFKVDYLPQVYLEKVYFQVIGVSHNVDSTGWFTTLETQFRIRPDMIDNPTIIDAPTEEKVSNLVVDTTKDGEPITAVEKYGDPKEKTIKVVLAAVTAVFPDIEDKKAYRWKKKFPGFATYTDDIAIQTYHIPTKGALSNSGYAPLKATDFRMAHNKKDFNFGDGCIMKKGQKIIVNQNFTSLLLIMQQVDSVGASEFSHLTHLYKFTVKSDLPVLIANPMYYWDEWDNRYNGYGYSRTFAIKGADQDTPIEKGYVRGIYMPGEVCWFGLNRASAKGTSHWFVAPTGTGNNSIDKSNDIDVGTGKKGLTKADLKTVFDISSFDHEWDTSDLTGEAAEGGEAGPTID